MPDYLNRLLTDGASLSWVQARLNAGLTAEQIYKDEWSGSNGHPARLLGCELRPPDFSDSGNADIFCRTYREQLIYTDSRGWLAYDGKRWEANDHQAFKLAGKLSADMLEDAKREYFAAVQQQAEVEVAVSEGTQDDEAKDKAKKITKSAKSYLDHAQQLRNERRLKAMLELAKHELAVDPSILDADPDILNTPGGIIHLPTGKLMPHDPKRFCTKITAVSPGTKGAEMWINHLKLVTQNDGSLMGFHQEVGGMCLFGKVYQEGAIFADGGGANGKSSTYNAEAIVLGDYAGSIDVKTLTTDKQNRGPTLATLRGLRMVLCGELEEGKRLSPSTLKQICSTDKINAEEKFKAPESFKPSHTLIMYTNHMPKVGSTDKGTWRRIIVVPFKADLEASGVPVVKNYEDVLAKEAGPAILAWMLEGARNFAADGFHLSISDAVDEATEAYKDNENWLGNFLSECCVQDPNARIRTGDLYKAYQEWAVSLNEYVRRGNDFTAAMQTEGFVYTTSKGYKTWHGIRLSSDVSYKNYRSAIG